MCVIVAACPGRTLPSPTIGLDRLQQPCDPKKAMNFKDDWLSVAVHFHKNSWGTLARNIPQAGMPQEWKNTPRLINTMAVDMLKSLILGVMRILQAVILNILHGFVWCAQNVDRSLEKASFHSLFLCDLPWKVQRCRTCEKKTLGEAMQQIVTRLSLLNSRSTWECVRMNT